MRVLFVFLKPAKVKMYEISGKCYFLSVGSSMNIHKAIQVSDETE